MKTIRFHQFGPPSVLSEEEVPLPKPARNEVRVKIQATGFNPVDAKIRSGDYPVELPFTPGADFSGVVDAVGDLVRDFEVGDAVFGMAFMACSNGSYAEYLCLPHHFLAKKPKTLTFEEAAAVPVAYLTAFQALIGTGALQQNRPLFLAGASGGVGSAALSLIRAYKGGPVYTLAGSDTSRDYLVRHFSIPASQILSYKGKIISELADQLVEMNGKNRFYLAVDLVGGPLKELCVRVADYNGHVVSVLAENKDYPLQVWGRGEESLFWQKSLSLHMIFVGAAIQGGEKQWSHYKTQLAHLAKMFERGELQPPHVEVVGPFSAKTAEVAHERLEEKHTHGKLVMFHS